MTPDESDSDRTLIQPRGGGGPGAGFDKTQVYGAAPAQPPSEPPSAPFGAPLGAPPGATVLVPPPVPDMGNGLAIGTRLGEFELIKLLGEGGFGIVYLATDQSLQRRVALKEYMPSSLAARFGESQVQVKSERYRETFEAGRKSFINEARLLAQFDHPSLVKVYRFWEANGTAYMVMPFYEGKTLRDTLRATPHRPDEQWLRTLLLPLTEALEVIHAEQCYHRDIAPDNVMMLASTQRPLLLDFGAARRVIGDMTQALTVILKPGYAPVEQYAEIPGMKQGAWTDVYALAAVVHYAITGRTPPPSVGRLLSDTYQPLVKVAAGQYSVAFLAAIDRALAVRPEGRTQSVAQLREEMGLTQPAPDSKAQRPLPSHPPADEPTVLLAALPPTEVFLPTRVAPPPPAPVRPSTPVAPSVGAAPLTETKTETNGTVIGIGIGAGVLLLAALGFGGWKVMTAPAPAPASVAAPAPAPTADAAPAPAAAQVATQIAPQIAPQIAAPAVLARFDPEREFDRIVQAQTAGFGVKADAVKPALRISKGDDFKFRVTAERDGFVYVLGQSPDGSLALLVPNTKMPSVRVQKGQTWNFPTKADFILSASEPVGVSRMVVIVSALKRNFDALQPKPEGPIKLFPAGDQVTALAAQFKGPNSPLAGQPECVAGGACGDEYGAALMKFETSR